MAALKVITLVNLLVLIAICVNNIRSTAALPTVDKDTPPKPHGSTGKQQQENEIGAQSVEASQVAIALESASAALQAGKQQSTVSTGLANIKQVHANNAEKVKRGLTNFMNHLNPAPYFVPAKATVAGKPSATASSQAEPATIVNEGSSADVLIKGPNRLVQARQLGGPLRWGRR